MGPTQTVFPITDIILPFITAIFKYAASFWWLWLFLLLLVIFEETWLFYRRSLYKNKTEWTVFEIQIPREIKKTPKAMEQTLLQLYNQKNAPDDFPSIYIEGEITLWWSLEIVSQGGEIHFYIRAPKKHAHITQTSFYAHYPDIELIEVPDYAEKIPKTTSEFYGLEQDVHGTEIILKKEDVYPIRTYEEFKTLPEEGETLDPLSAFLENLSKIGKNENIYIQFLIKPVGDSWTKKAEPVIKKIKESNKIKTGKEDQVSYLPLTNQQTETLKAIENSVSKHGFEMIIRFLYSAPKTDFSAAFAKTAVISALNQYASQNLNSFKGNSKVEPKTSAYKFPHVAKTERKEGRKQRLLSNFLERKMPEESFMAKLWTTSLYSSGFNSKTFILNVEELATIYHLPNKFILAAPYIKLMPSKKMGPPAGLPIFTQE